MDGTKTTNGTGEPAIGRSIRRRQREVANDSVRYFLPKSGSSTEKPDLGQELASEGEALVQAFKSGQVFYTVVAWKAEPDINGKEPRIVKQVLSHT